MTPFLTLHASSKTAIDTHSPNRSLPTVPFSPHSPPVATPHLSFVGEVRAKIYNTAPSPAPLLPAGASSPQDMQGRTKKPRHSSDISLSQPTFLIPCRTKKTFSSSCHKFEFFIHPQIQSASFFYFVFFFSFGTPSDPPSLFFVLHQEPQLVLIRWPLRFGLVQSKLPLRKGLSIAFPHQDEELKRIIYQSNPLDDRLPRHSGPTPPF